MRTATRLLAALMLSCSAALAQETPAGTPETDQAIARLREGLIDSFNRADIDRLLTFLDTNAVVTWQNGEVCQGTAAVKSYYDRMMKGERPVVAKVTAEPQVLGRHIQGDWAVSWGNLNDHFVLTDGRDLPLHSGFTATIARRGDRWLVTAFHASVNAFDNPILGLAVKKVSLLMGCVGALIGLVLGFFGARLLRQSEPAAQK